MVPAKPLHLLPGEGDASLNLHAALFSNMEQQSQQAHLAANSSAAYEQKHLSTHRNLYN